MENDTVKSINEFRIMPGNIAPYIVEIRLSGENNWRLLDIADSIKEAQKIIDQAKTGNIGVIQ